MKKLFILFLCFFLAITPSVVFSATEDLTTFTEVDSNSDITVTTAKCDVVTMPRSANSSVYKSYGSGNFGNFRHDFTTEWTASAGNATTMLWSVSNTAAGTVADLLSANAGYSINIFHDNGTGEKRFSLWNYHDDDNTHVVGALNTVYYISVERTVSTMELRIYSDSARTSLVGSTTVNHNGTTYEYLSVCGSRDASGGESNTFYTQDFDLDPTAATRVKSALIMIAP